MKKCTNGNLGNIITLNKVWKYLHTDDAESQYFNHEMDQLKGIHERKRLTTFNIFFTLFYLKKALSFLKNQNIQRNLSFFKFMT